MTLPRSEEVRRKLSTLASKNADVQKKLGEAHTRKAKKEKEANDHETSAARTTSTGIRSSHMRQAASARAEAIKESKKIADLSKTLASISKDESSQRTALAAAEKNESAAAKREREKENKRSADERREDDRRRQRERLEDERRRASDLTATTRKIQESESRITEQMTSLQSPKKEELRILYATASSHGDLRVDEEIRRVKAAVKSATHREQVKIEHLPAATAGDILDALTAFKPHVVHFSGHANENVLVFDTGSDTKNDGRAITARAFKSALEAPDAPPTLVVLNACESAAQLETLLGKVPMAIGMTDSIGDIDSLVFATRFYRSLAEGQSVSAALATARADMEMSGLQDADLPILETLPGIDPTTVHLIVA